MKFLVPNYSCLQNPWLGGYHPPDPRPLCPQLNLLNPPRKRFLATPLVNRWPSLEREQKGDITCPTENTWPAYSLSSETNSTARTFPSVITPDTKLFNKIRFRNEIQVNWRISPVTIRPPHFKHELLQSTSVATWRQKFCVVAKGCAGPGGRAD